ncbi:hypothetical protein Hanom_Chr00s000494g01646001 [Helianthus anomalus]
MHQLPSRLDLLTVVAEETEWIFLVVDLRPKGHQPISFTIHLGYKLRTSTPGLRITLLLFHLIHTLYSSKQVLILTPDGGYKKNPVFLSL